MLKWFLIFLGACLLLGLAAVLFIGFMIWNHERGYPRSILAEEEKGICLVSKKSFVLLKTQRASLKEKVFNFLPKPEEADYIYRDYVPGTYLDKDGKEAIDLTGAIEVPEGTRFIFRDGFQHRTLNDTEFFYWLVPDGLELDSSYFFRSIGLGKTVEEMRRFPDDELFEQACDDGA